MGNMQIDKVLERLTAKPPNFYQEIGREVENEGEGEIKVEKRE